MAALEKDKAALTEETRRLKVDLKKAQEEGQTREAQNQDSSEHPTNDKVNLFLNKQSLLRFGFCQGQVWPLTQLFSISFY